MSIQYFGKGALRVAKNYTKGYSDAQAKVREATSNDPWGPYDTQMDEIAWMTYNRGCFIEITEVLDKRLNDKGKNWRHVFKSLTLLDYCLRAGSEHVVRYFRDNLYIVNSLREFRYIDKYGNDQGANVRKKANDIANLLSDDTRLQQERGSRTHLRDLAFSRTFQDPQGNTADDDLRKAIEESQRTVVFGNGDTQLSTHPARDVTIPTRPPSPTTLPLPPVAPPTCTNCKNRPVAPNPTTGQYFGYCSKACATQARNPSSNNKGGNVHTMCEQCKRRPRFIQGTKVHPYCGRACAQLAANTGPAPVNPPVKPLPLPPLQEASPGLTERSLPTLVHRGGAPSEHRVEAHIDWGEHGCISCRAAAMINASVLCRSCHDGALRKAPVIIQVLEDHKNYKSVEKQFKQSWRHKTQCPEVKAVYKIIVTEASMNQYQEYIDGVEARGNFVALGKPRGNEHRRWHGTKRKCNIGDPGNNTFCADLDCSLCCIIQRSFDLRLFKAATGWGRFGHGIYTSSTSSKSNDYSKNLGINSEWKALLLNKVVVGNGMRLIQNDTSLTKPPAGYDSVVAEVAPGGALNYDELVVYRNEAVRPSYLVMYQCP